MERIIYRKTLDVHKNGIQFTLQGFETADNMSRRIEITLMASGDTIDLPLEQLVAMMYVTTPNATEPSINECTIKDNTIIYDVLPIVESGITEMQLKLIETRPNGANGVLATPKFAVEVSESGTNEESATQSTTYTALEDAIAKAQGVYDSRFLRMEIGTDCTFRAYYADGTIYESDIFKGEAVLAQSYAVGGTGIRVGEDTDNSKYYSSVSESASAEASRVRTEAAELLEEVTKHGVYTSFDINFETGEVNYISPQYDFEINKETGCLEAIGEAYNAEESQELLIDDWLTTKSMELETKTGGISERVSTIEENTDSMYNELEVLSDKATTMEDDIDKAKGRIDYLENTVLDGVFNIENGGTGANNVEEARENLGVVSKDDVQFKIYNSLSTIGLSGKVTTDEVFAAMPNYSILILSNNKNETNYISDVSTPAMLVELTKTTTRGTGRATQINNKSANFYDYSWYGGSPIVSSGWKLPLHSASDITSGTLDSARLPIVPISKGGTGADNVATARKNLGAAPTSHNHAASAINSGTLDSARLPVVPITKGGTGANNVATARENLGFVQNVLWNSNMLLGKHTLLNEYETVSLAQPISAQPNGIVLVFSALDSDGIKDHHFEVHFIPKHIISKHVGGYELHFATSAFGVVGAKYLYIYDSKIKGSEDNIKMGTASSGITYNNAHWALRYVIGV